jgi:hypothetical protein
MILRIHAALMPDRLALITTVGARFDHALQWHGLVYTVPIVAERLARAKEIHLFGFALDTATLQRSHLILLLLTHPHNSRIGRTPQDL